MVNSEIQSIFSTLGTSARLHGSKWEGGHLPFAVLHYAHRLMWSMLAMICILGMHVSSLVKDGRVGAGLKTFLEQDCLDGSFACMCSCLLACRETWACA